MEFGEAVFEGWNFEKELKVREDEVFYINGKATQGWGPWNSDEEVGW